MAVRGVDDICLDLEVNADEVGRVCVVGMDATNFGGCQDDELGPLGSKEGFNIILTGEVEFQVGAEDKVREAQVAKLADNGGAHKPTVACHKDLC